MTSKFEREVADVECLRNEEKVDFSYIRFMTRAFARFD